MNSEDKLPGEMPPLLPSRDGYVPIGERLNQDVWHDNFVPKYSAIASAEPSRMVLVGVWVLFGPMVLFSLLGAFAYVGWAQDLGSVLAALSWSSLYGILPAMLLWKQTKRYMDHRRTRPTVDDDG